MGSDNSSPRAPGANLSRLEFTARPLPDVPFGAFWPSSGPRRWRMSSMTRETADAADPLSSDECLAWVIVDGVPRHVSDFAGLAARARPIALCPHCGRRLILRLGRVRRHHAAHQPGAVCAATRPETALHLDCKFALAAALGAASEQDVALVFRRRCAGGFGASCEETNDVAWVGGWDAVRVEHGLADHRRPDILLLRAGEPIGAVEIVVSNKVSDEKAAALATLGVPWVEIDADARFTRPGTWQIDQPIDARRVNDAAAWRCAVHSAEYATRQAVRAVRERAPDDCARTTTLRAARVVDVYRSTGGRERFIYRIVEESVVGSSSRHRLLRGTAEVAVIEVNDERSDRDAAHLLQVAFREDVSRLARDDGAFSDSPMHWAREAAAEFIVQEALFDRRLPDPTVLATTYPRRWFYAPQSTQWFLPDDMRDVRWDRPADDPFAPHPASRARDGVRHARPAPEGSSATPIFARRPTAFAFGKVGERVEVAPGIVQLAIAAKRGGKTTHRALFVVEREVDDETIISVRSANGVSADALWLSHPRDWRPAMQQFAWAPAGRDSRGRGLVLIDTIGVFRAEAFIQAIQSDDRRVRASTVRDSMAARVERLAASRR